MAQALEQPRGFDRAQQLRRCAADAPPFGRATMCELDADVIGQPQGPIASLGLADGSCPELPPPAEDDPAARRRPESAHSRGPHPQT